MNYLTDYCCFSVPFPREAHELAQKNSRLQNSSKKAKQAYLNGLAIYAVKFYLDCMGIATNWEKSHSSDPAIASLMNLADLEITGLGKIECRPVLPDEDTVNFPQEFWTDRIGYVAVKLDRTLQQGTVLGFIPAVTRETWAINQLLPLEDFLEHLSTLQPQSINLGRWLDRIFEVGWQTIESLLEPQHAELAFNFRNKATLTRDSNTIQRGKQIDLERSGEKVALCVGLKPINRPEMDIWVEVFPTGGKEYLPQDLQLIVLDEDGEAVMQAQARSTKNIQLQFTGEPGEKFSVKVALGDVSITEAFSV
jgi:Protein of unknown function (DUF1822)